MEQSLFQSPTALRVPLYTNGAVYYVWYVNMVYSAIAHSSPCELPALQSMNTLWLAFSELRSLNYPPGGREYDYTGSDLTFELSAAVGTLFQYTTSSHTPSKAIPTS